MLRLPQSSVVFVLAVCLTVTAQPANGDWVFTHGGHSYQLVTTPRNWANAAADAASRQMFGRSGTLVHIDDQAENSAIITELLGAIPAGDFGDTIAPDGGRGSYVWIGATDRDSEGVWLWDGNNDGLGDQFWAGNRNGNSVGGLYNHWGHLNGSQREPDNYNEQDAAGISLNGWPLGAVGEWNDVGQENTLYYLVEFNAVPEPASFALLCFSGLFGLAWWVLSRRKK